MSTHGPPRPIVRIALTKPEVALAIGVGVHAVDGLVAAGGLPPPRHWGDERLWLVSEVEAYLRAWPTDDGAQAKRSISVIDDRPFTPETLAKRWGCTGNHIRHMVSAGELPSFRLGNKLVRIPSQAVVDIESRSVGMPDKPVSSDVSPANPEAIARRDVPPIVLRHSRRAPRSGRGRGQKGRDG